MKEQFLQLLTNILFMTVSVFGAGESLPTLKDGLAPQNLDELWFGYDPRVEPLETEVVKEWKRSAEIYHRHEHSLGMKDQFHDRPGYMYLNVSKPNSEKIC